MLWWPMRANLDFKINQNLNCEIKQNLTFKIKHSLDFEKKTEPHFRNKTESHFQNKTESHFRNKIESHFSKHIWMNLFKPKLKRLFALRYSYKKHAFLILTQSMLTSRRTCSMNYISLIFWRHLQLFTDFFIKVR